MVGGNFHMPMSKNPVRYYKDDSRAKMAGKTAVFSFCLADLLL
jgi:hypothetical protein